MIYRAEVMIDSGVVSAKNYSDLYNPLQASRRISAPFRKSGADYLTVYVLNEDGVSWKYVLKKGVDGRYKSMRSGKFRDVVAKDDVIDVMAGNSTIKGVTS